MPIVPMEIPSLTPIVLNCIGTRPSAAINIEYLDRLKSVGSCLPAFEMPCLTRLLRSMRCILHGFPVYHTDEMPTWALSMSSSFIPVAYNMACEAPWDFGCVM